MLEPAVYNDKTSLMLCCPITTQIKNYPFEVLIGGTPKNVALADQVKSLDWRQRNAIRKAPLAEELNEARAKIRADRVNTVLERTRKNPGQTELSQISVGPNVFSPIFLRRQQYRLGL